MINISPAIQAKGKSGPDLASLGLKSPMDVIDILSLLKVGNERVNELVVKDDKAFLDPKAKAQTVVDFFNKLGFSPKDLPYLAAAIKRDMKHGVLKMGNENRILLSPSKLKNYFKKIKHSQTPPEMRTERRQFSEKSLIDTKPPAKTAVQRKILKFHPEIPKETPAGVEQCTGNLTTLRALCQGELAKVVNAAIKEQRLLGAPA